MFCQQCGQPLDATARFCASCGARTPLNGQTLSTPAGPNEISDSVARQSLAGHVRVIGILWAIYSGFRILMATWMIFFSRVLMPSFVDQVTQTMAQQNSNAPDIAPIIQSVMHLMSGIYLFSAAAGIFGGALGFWTAWALMKRERPGRILALVVACVSLINIPFGTALGVYTLVIFLPSKADRYYRELSSPAA